MREERERQRDQERQEQAFLDQARRDMERDAQEEAIRRIVNDPEIVIDRTLLEIINDPLMTMDKEMTVRRTRPGTNRPMLGRQVIRQSGQFANLALGVDLPKKKTRKKTKTNKLQAEALRQANAKLRKKNGQLRKGKTQADVMSLAHRIRKKLS